MNIRRLHRVLEDLEREGEACTGCPTTICSTDVVVYADSTGRDGKASEPYHLDCYLRAADLNLNSNAPLRQFVRRVINAAITKYVGGQS